MERCLRRVERIFRGGQIRAGINLSTAASAAQRYDSSETVWPPFFANRENLDEEVPNEISGEDLNGLRLLDKALDEALVQLVWRYRALVGIREVEPGPERPLTEGERHTRQ